MSIELAVLSFLSFVVFLAFFALLRIENDPALRFWSLAWGMMLLDRILSGVSVFIGEGWLADTLLYTTYATSPMIAFSMMLGAVVYCGRSLRQWMFVAAVAISLTRCALASLDYEVVAQLISLTTEGPGLLASAVLLLISKQRSNTVLVLVRPLLATGYVAMATLETMVAWSLFTQGSAVWLVLPAASLAFYASSTQLMAVFDRVWSREAESERSRSRDLKLLREIARLSGGRANSESFAVDALELLRTGLDVSAGGIWLLDAESNRLNCIRSFGFPESIIDAYRDTAVQGPVAAILRSGKPTFSMDLPDDVSFFPDARAAGLREGALMPLCWHSDILGMFVLAIDGVEHFDTSRRNLFLAVTDELALAFHHIQALEAQSRQAEVLAQERRTLRAVLDVSPAGILVEDGVGMIAMWNPAVVRHLGASDGERWRGGSMLRMLSELGPHLENGEADVARLHGLASQAESEGDLEISFRQPMARDLILFTSPVHSADGERLGRVWISRDISEERALEAQLHQAQKLDTLGRLSGGIAHDFNNQLTTILGNARFLLNQNDGNSDTRESLEDLERAAKHCAGLTRSLLTFSRRTPIAVRVLSVSDELDELFELLRPLMPASIALTVEVDENLERVAADPVQLQQIFVNLAVNSRDAIVDSGTVVVHASNRVVDLHQARLHPGATPGRYVEFCVSDDGPGIPAASLGRIFEPFYTTKSQDRGTGLGLSIVYGLVQSHGGWVEVESEVGEGTRFRVVLPSASEIHDPIDLAAETVEAVGYETVLIAEDNIGVQRLAARTLSDAGFDVIVSSDGLEAVTKYGEHHNRISLMLLDVEMPGASGPEALKQMREMGADQPVIFTSGNADQNVADALGGDIIFIDKPYDPADLVRQIRLRIDQTSKQI